MNTTDTPTKHPRLKPIVTSSLRMLEKEIAENCLMAKILQGEDKNLFRILQNIQRKVGQLLKDRGEVSWAEEEADKITQQFRECNNMPRYQPTDTQTDARGRIGICSQEVSHEDAYPHGI